MNIEKTLELNSHEIDLVVGAVTESPDGRSCTEHQQPTQPEFAENQGGPVQFEMGPLF